MSIHHHALVSIDEKDTLGRGRLSKFAVFVLLSLGLALTAFVQPALAAPPTVSRVTPSSGPLSAGEIVLVTGTGFTGATAVAFGSTPATDFAVVSDKQIVATAPAASAGAKETVLVTVGGETNSTGGTYEFLAPTIKKLDPGWATDSSGTVVTITGTGLLGTAASEVKFNDGSDDFVATDIWVISDKQIIVKTPVDDSDNSIDVPNGNLDVIITRNSVDSVPDEDSKFLFTPGLPTISALEDGSSGAVTSTEGVAQGASLTIVGTQLWGVTEVAFGTTKVKTDIVIASAGTSLTVPVPNKSAGPSDVTVTNARGTSAEGLKTSFSFLATTAPTITKAYPSALDKAVGGTVLLTGRGLTGVTPSDITVDCEGTGVTVTSANPVSDTSIILTMPTKTTAASCDFVIANPADSSLTGSKSALLTYI